RQRVTLGFTDHLSDRFPLSCSRSPPSPSSLIVLLSDWGARDRLMAHSAAACFLPLLFTALFLLSSCSFGSGIPTRYDGFYYSGEVGDWKDVIVVDAFLDPLCPDSRDAWPPLKQVVRLYSPRLVVIVHPFPLPYHNNAFVACRALHIANKLNASSTFPLLELFFKYQERYYNGPTKSMSRSAIIDDMAKLANGAYGCTRGVAGAPFFFVNGFLLPDAGSALDLETWKSIIGPLLKNQREQVIKF
ncbi:ribonuclease P MRP 25kDa, partial [Musa troglodytarum]